MENKNNKLGDQLFDFFRENTSWIFLAILIFIGIISSDFFMTSRNIINVLRQITVTGMIAIGFTFVLIAGGMDLSIGANVSLCSVVVIKMLNSGAPIVVAILCTMLVGMTIGLVNGLIVKAVRATTGASFLITMGMALAVQSIALIITNGYEVYVDHEQYEYIGKGLIGFVPIPLLILLGAIIISHFVLKYTKFGRDVYLSGANKQASYLSGVDVANVRMTAFIIAGLFAALTAILLTARTTGGGPRAGKGYEFQAAIIAIVGGNDIAGGKGSVIKTLCGALIYGLITNITTLRGMEPNLVQVITGVVLIVAVLLSRFSEVATNGRRMQNEKSKASI